MTLSEISIKRPVFAIVLSLTLMLFGFFSFQSMSVREYPDIDPPTVSVTTNWAGANANIVETQITQILEEEIAGIGGLKRISAVSREGSSSISVEFGLSRNIDDAASDVRDRVSRAVRRLPDSAEPPSIVKTEADARPMMWIVASSDRMNALQLTDYAQRHWKDRFSFVDGVSRVRIFGKTYAMRIWLKRDELAARGLTVNDVEAAIRAQNVELPSGRIESVNRELSVRTATALKTPEEFAAVIVAERDGYAIRLSEVADVELAAEDERSSFRANGRPAIGLGVVRQSRANMLDVARGVRAELAQIQSGLPLGMTLDLSYDQAVFVEGSMNEVYKALGIAMVLVILVICLFLRSLRATVIPALAIPVSITAAFIVLAALDYSVNVLTLLALVLAIGLVVDDAIIVLENIHRRIEKGEPPLLAAVNGSRQVAFAVIATTVVLVAVFTPLSFLEGAVGRLFREFGIAVAVAAIFSSFVALTLTPMLCSRILRPSGAGGGMALSADENPGRVARFYRRLLARTLNAPVVMLSAGLLLSGLACLFYLALPQELAPREDRGVIFVSAQAPEGSSLAFTARYVDELEESLAPLVAEGVAERYLTLLAPGFGRAGDVNRAFGIIRLKDWDEREVSQQDVLRRIFPEISAVPGLRAVAFGIAPLGQRFSPSPVQIIIGGPDYDLIEQWADRLIGIAETNPGLKNPQKDYNRSLPELRLHVDRDRAAALGVRVQDIGRALETLLGGRQVTSFERGGQDLKVLLRARRQDRVSPEDLRGIHVRATSGAAIPLASLVSLSEGTTVSQLRRTDRLRSITVTASLAPGYALGEALDFLEQAAAESFPPQARISFAGESKEFKSASSALNFALILALAVVFLALAAQFESFIHPITIISAAPLAATGALATMLIFGASFNVYSQIALIMLIGLAAKNAILIVEFANQLRDEGHDIREAVLDAASIRLRPILMTATSTGIGAAPLALATGAGAEAREAIGLAIIGGVAFSTLVSLFLTPLIYLGLARFTRPVGFVARMLNEQRRQHADKAGAGDGSGGGS